MSRIREHLLALATAFDHKPSGFIVEYGEPHYLTPRSFAGRRGRQGECYRNAALLAMGSGLIYVEGYVAVYGVPIEHAWCIDDDGAVVDPTMRPAVDGTFDRITDFYGVPFETQYVSQAANTNAVWGLFNWHYAQRTLPKLVELGLEDGQRWLREVYPI